MKRFQFHDTRNSHQVWQVANYVSDYTDVHSFFCMAQIYNWRRQAFAILRHLKSKKLKIYSVNRDRAIIFPAVPQMMMTHQNKLELVVNLLVCVVYLFLYGEHECDVSIQDSSS